MSETANIRVFQGNLRGRKTTTKSGGPLFSFMGIPYARPPIGALRFQPPQRPEPWAGTRDAGELASICLQIDMINREIAGQEDCLYLNVYSPQLPSRQNTLLKPVMVWIHGGGFTHGSGNPDIYGPDYLVDRDVVLVTINYRVGVLGFLSLDNKAVPGNMGLKDQVAALHWVKENIASFGGDPNNVTIFGESAGGASVHYLMLSPLSKGLFHKVIAQSGCALNPWAFSLKNTTRAFQLGQILGCKTNDPAELLNFLMKKDATQLVEVSHKLIHWSENLAGIKFPFVPTLEPNLPGAFMSEHPLHSLQTGRFHKVPFMIGRTTHEGIIMLRDMKENLWSKMNANFEKQFPEKLTNISYNIPTSIIAAKIRNFYFNNKPISENSVAEYVDFQTDLSFAEGIHTTLKLSIAQSNNPVYFYVFGFDGELGFAKQFSNSNIKGTCHADELGYLFRSHLIDIDVEPSSPEMKTINRMVSLWTNFAKTGNPTPYARGRGRARVRGGARQRPARGRVRAELHRHGHGVRRGRGALQGPGPARRAEHQRRLRPGGSRRGHHAARGGRRAPLQLMAAAAAATSSTARRPERHRRHPPRPLALASLSTCSLAPHEPPSGLICGPRLLFGSSHGLGPHGLLLCSRLASCHDVPRGLLSRVMTS